MVNIHVYSIKKLVTYGKFENCTNEKEKDLKQLVVPKEYLDFAHLDLDERRYCIKENENGCHLFKQFSKQYPKAKISDAFILINFENCTNTIFNTLKVTKRIVIRNKNGDEIRFVDFLKTSNMGANKKEVFYINENYVEKISERVTFNVLSYCNKSGDGTPSIQIPKYYAATGLSLSSCDIFDDLKLRGDEICVIPDCERYVERGGKGVRAIICISKKSIHKELETLIDQLERLAKKSTNSIDPKTILDDAIKMVSNLYYAKESKDFSALQDKKIVKSLQNIFIPENFSVDEINKLLEICKDGRNLLSESEEVRGNCSKIDWYKIEVDNYFIKTNMFDGEGLVSEEFAEEINKRLEKLASKKEVYRSKPFVKSGSFQIRLPFIKGTIHTADLKTFFVDNKVKYIKGKSYIDVNNIEYLKKHNLLNKYEEDKNSLKYIYYDVRALKVIITESQLKFLKEEILTKMFFDRDQEPIKCYFDTLLKYQYGIGINHTDPEFSKTIKMNHEFWSTIPLYHTKDNEDEFNNIKNKILEPTERNLKKLTNPKIIGHELYNNDFYSLDYEYHQAGQDFYLEGRKGKKFIENNYFNYIYQLCLGKVEMNGVRLFLASDLLALLYKVIEREMPTNYALQPYQFYVDSFFINKSLFADKKPYLFMRAPHYSRNEIGVLFNKGDEDIRSKYFKKLRGVVMINAKSLTAERMGGADYDGDQVFISCCIDLNNYCRKYLYPEKEYQYPLVVIPSIKKDAVDFIIANKIESWKTGFDSKIGKISNIAFKQALEVYKEDTKYEENEMAFYTLVSGLDIDSRKTGYSPSKYFLRIPNNAYASTFIENNDISASGDKSKYVILRDKKKNIETLLKKANEVHKDWKSNNILVDFVKEFANRNPDPFKVGDAYKSKHSISAIKIGTPNDCGVDIANALIKYFTYEAFKSYTKFINNHKGAIESIANKISTKLNSLPNISFPDLTSIFKVKDAGDALAKVYRKASVPFHFLNNDKDKYEELLKYDFTNSELKDYLSNKIQSKASNVLEQKYGSYVNFLCSFENDGFMTLYYLLHYQLYNDIIDVKHLKDLYNYKEFINVVSNVKKKAKACKYNENEIDKLIKGSCLPFLEQEIKDYSKLLGKSTFSIKERLDTKFGHIRLSAIRAISSKNDIQNDEEILTIFSEDIINYLKEGIL